MAETSLGRASLSVTADLSGFTTALEQAASKTAELGNTNAMAAESANKVTVATEQQTKSLEELQRAAVQGVLNLAQNKQQILASKLATEALALQSTETIFLAYNEKKLALEQASLTTAQKEFQFNLLESGRGMQAFARDLEIQNQKQKTLELSTRKLTAEMMAADSENISQITTQKTLASQIDMATRKMELQSRQMMLESGATKQLYQEMALLEEQEKALAEQEEKLRNEFSKTKEIQETVAQPVAPRDMVQESILAANMKQEQVASKLATDAMVLQDGATLILIQDQKKLEAQQAKLATSSKQLENSLLKNDQAFRNNTFEIQKNIQKQQLYELNQRNLLVRMSAVDQESIKMVSIQKRLTTETDMAAKKMDLQARQMLIESGAAAKLAKEMAELEEMEQSIIAVETTLQNQFKKTTKVMEEKAQASNIEQPKKLDQIKPVKMSLGIKDYLGIGAATAAFNKLFDLIGAGISRSINHFKSLGSQIIEQGSKFESANNRLTALTGDATLGAGLQQIMRAGPSPGFEALTEHATRLAALKFNPASVQDLIGRFNTLGVALGNPERIMALIVDKIGDMAADGQATMPALSKLAEEGIPVWDALAARLSQTTGRMVSVAEAQQMVANGMVNVSEATAAIGDAANMPNIQGAAQQAANSFSGVWATAAANVQAVFQKIGSTILEGFNLNSLGGGITDFFNFVMEKIDSIGPLLQGVGVFASSVVDIVLTGLNEFLAGWEITTGELSIEDIVLAAQEAALDFVQSIYDFGKGIFDFFKPVGELFSGIMFLVNSFTTGLKVVWDFLKDITGKATEWVVWILEKVGAVEKGTTDQLKKMQEEAKKLEEQRSKEPKTGPDKFFEEQRKKLEELKMKKPQANAGGDETDFWLDQMFGKAEKNAEKLKPKINELGKATKEAADKAKEFANNLNPTNVMRTEEAPWKKFLAENLTPLQQYENEIAKLNLMLDGSEEGFAAFAMGSASALKKLKDATGLGGETKFAGAIAKGSEADYKATLDAMGQNVDVQQQIKETLEAARQLQEQQLQAQKDIATAILAMPKPAKGVNVMVGG
jgi:tape measure domain-containing protein